MFNFFKPDYQHAGTIRDRNLYSPAFQILNETTITRTTNQLRASVLYRDRDRDDIPENFDWYWGKNQVLLDLSIEKALADRPVELVDRLNLLLMAGQMSSTMQQIVTAHVEATPLWDDGRQRVEEALFLIVTSPEFAVQR